MSRTPSRPPGEVRNRPAHDGWNAWPSSGRTERRLAMKARIIGAAAAALIALTVSLVAFAGTPWAAATQGQAIIAGQSNSETKTTTLYNTTVGWPDCTFLTSNIGLTACGTYGLGGAGLTGGVLGITEDRSTGYGVEGRTVKGTGVY